MGRNMPTQGAEKRLAKPSCRLPLTACKRVNLRAATCFWASSWHTVGALRQAAVNLCVLKSAHIALRPAMHRFATFKAASITVDGQVWISGSGKMSRMRPAAGWLQSTEKIDIRPQLPRSSTSTALAKPAATVAAVTPSNVRQWRCLIPLHFDGEAFLPLRLTLPHRCGAAISKPGGGATDRNMSRQSAVTGR